VRSLRQDTTYTVACCGNSAPSCSCRDWCRHHLPCKHVLAVFMYKPAYGWESLPAAYTQLPIFCLDTEVVGSAVVSDIPEHSCSNEQSQHNDVNTTHDVTENMPADYSVGKILTTGKI